MRGRPRTWLEQRHRGGDDPGPAGGGRRHRAARRLRMGHAGGHRSHHPAHDRRRQPHSLSRRVAHRHRARESLEEPCAAREHGPVAAAAQRLAVDHHRRGRHRVLGDEAGGTRVGTPARGARAEDDRQRPRSAPAHRHVRIPDRAPLRRGDRQEPDGRRENDVTLVPRDRHGPHRRPLESRHREGRGRHALVDPRGVLCTAPPQGARRHAGRRHHQAHELRPPGRGRRDWRRGRPAHQRRRSRETSRGSSATRTGTCASPRSTSARF